MESLGGDMFGSAYNFMLNEVAAGYAHERAKDIMKYQNQLARENWSMNNAYNTPARQRERLAAAGLNPDLMYQSGASGLQSAGMPAPAAVASGAKGGAIDSSLGSRAANAAAALEMADKTHNESLAQEIRNQYLREQINLELDNMNEDIKLKGKNRELAAQHILESQNNIDIAKRDMTQKEYDRFLSTLTTVGQLERWQHENDLTDEQKKWVGTGAMASLIGAKGAAAQAEAMANAINMFRDPKVLHATIKAYIEEFKKAYGEAKSGILEPLWQGLNRWAQGESESETGEYITDGHGNRVPVVDRSRHGKKY